ncbi:hypothetical protein SRHO_G00165640 [Serrasalmus rhombeus]
MRSSRHVDIHMDQQMLVNLSVIVRQALRHLTFSKMIRSCDRKVFDVEHLWLSQAFSLPAVSQACHRHLHAGVSLNLVSVPPRDKPTSASVPLQNSFVN